MPLPRLVALALALALALAGPAVAQRGSLRVGMQSPTAASLGQVADVPVNLYTGKPSVRVPLFTVEGKTLSLPIALDYGAGGVRVEEVGGWVGLGWSLDAGGVITRTVRGLPDDSPNGYYHQGHRLYQAGNWPTPPDALLYDIKSDLLDAEPDLYHFNVAGRGGQIALLPAGATGADGRGRAVPAQPLQITPTFSSGYITEWTIRTEDGTAYRFAGVETTTDWNQILPLGSFTGRWGDSYTSAWYLTEVRSPSGNDVITLTYDEYTATHRLSTYVEKTSHLGGGSTTFSSEPPLSAGPERRADGSSGTAEAPVGVPLVAADTSWAAGFAPAADGPPAGLDVAPNAGLDGAAIASAGSCSTGQTEVANQYQVQALRLASISAAGHTATFAATTLRDDATAPGGQSSPPIGTKQERRLDTVTITAPGGEVVRTFAFSYSYTSGSPRLRLDAVTERDKDGVALPPHSFAYDTQAFPARTSYSQDHWGYYNGVAQSTLIPELKSGTTVLPGADRGPRPAAAQAGSLTRITYPTGATTTFVWEGNDYGRVNALTDLLEESTTPRSLFLESGNGQGPLSAPFTVGGVGTTVVEVRVTLDPECGYAGTFDCPYAEIVGQRRYDRTGTYLLALAPGTYTLEVSDEFTGGPSSHATLTWQEVVATKKKRGGGLRVKEVRTTDALGGETVRAFQYTLAAETDRSSGVVTAEPSYAYVIEIPDCSFLSRASASRTPVGMTQGGHVGYAEVAVLEGATGEAGRTRHVFRTAVQAPDGPLGPNAAPWMPRTSADWKRGQALETRVLSASQAPVAATVWTHQFRDEDAGNGEPTTTRRLLAVSAQFFDGFDFRQYLGPRNGYEIVSAWTYVGTETVTTY